MNNYINFLRAKLSRGPRVPGSVENMGSWDVKNTGFQGLWKIRGPGSVEIMGSRGVKNTVSRGVGNKGGCEKHGVPLFNTRKELCFDSPKGGMRRVRLYLSAL